MTPCPHNLGPGCSACDLDAEIERILTMPEDELIAEAEAEGIDIEANAREMQALFEKAKERADLVGILRAAIEDRLGHLPEGDDRLPVILADVAITWSNTRRDAAVVDLRKALDLANEEIDRAHANGDKHYEAVQARDAQIARLTEALKFYANPEVYKPHPHGGAFDNRDLSFVARAALGPSDVGGERG